ncbi:MAG: hypothetical protein V7L21_31645 [Nostoc sp.]
MSQCKDNCGNLSKCDTVPFPLPFAIAITLIPTVFLLFGNN